MNKKKQTKRVIKLICIVVVVALLAAMPLLAKQDSAEDGPKASILSNTVSAGSINTELIGGGTLAEDDAVTISVPSAVKLQEFLVSNGDAVTEGTAIATVDRVTVMTAISQVQETLEYLSEQIEEESETDSEEAVTALAGGVVKILYAQEGASVQSVMLEHGALAVLSLDGLMAVDLETESELPAGTAVTVTLSDDTQVSGKIAKNLAGEMTVTLEDDGYAVDDKVQVAAEDGTLIGSGVLYIYSPWNATAYTGTVDSVYVDVDDTLDAGDTLMILEDVGYTATYRQLVAQRQEYEDLMLELFHMYQTQTITAPCDGVVSGIDKDSVQLLSAGGQGFIISFLANAPNGDDETLYVNYAGQVTGITSEGWNLNLNPQAIPIEDYTVLSGVSLDTGAMTQAVMHTQTGIPIYTLSGGTWTQISSSGIGVGDILLFAADTNGTLVWSVLLQKASQPESPTDPSVPTTPTIPADPSTPTTPTTPTDPSTPTTPTTPADPSTPTTPTTPTDPSTPTTPTTPADPSTPTTPTTPTDPSVPGNPGGSVPSGSGGSYPSGSGSSFPFNNGSFSSDSSWSTGTAMSQMDGYGYTESESAFALYGLEMADIAAVTPQDTVTLDITIDELDVNALQVGMTAQVKIDALGGEKYTATITEIGNTGASNGGNSKYTVELTMDRAENMLSGMNATATIVLSSVNDVLTIPADALVESGNQTFVYTGYDEENDLLLNPVTVRVGCSDGETVEILEGLAKGQTYYYAYYDTLEISFTPDFGGGGFMFG